MSSKIGLEVPLARFYFHVSWCHAPVGAWRFSLSGSERGIKASMDTINFKDGTEHQGPHEKKESTVKSWIVVLSIAFFFFFWGLCIYYAVGVGQPPSWRYGVVQDLPGQSVYSVQGVEKRAGLTISEGKSIRKQHIMGRREETGKPQGRKGF
ncbi:MAG: hypothetical protein HY787_00075 [Deltaproteobacteria bacterium]|nr:hypothetical protein [Deltaproteobacteria bacterium]